MDSNRPRPLAFPPPPTTTSEVLGADRTLNGLRPGTSELWAVPVSPPSPSSSLFSRCPSPPLPLLPQEPVHWYSSRLLCHPFRQLRGSSSHIPGLDSSLLAFGSGQGPCQDMPLSLVGCVFRIRPYGLRDRDLRRGTLLNVVFHHHARTRTSLASIDVLAVGEKQRRDVWALWTRHDNEAGVPFRSLVFPIAFLFTLCYMCLGTRLASRVLEYLA